jgi:speckle-type POZ protein
MSFAGVSIVGKCMGSAGHAINVASARGYHLLVVNGYSYAKAVTHNGTAFYSLGFMVGGHRWRIKYYPKGDNWTSADSLSLFLQLDDQDVTGPLKVRYIFSFVDELEKQDSAYVNAAPPGMFSSNAPSWGYTVFMKNNVLEKSNHLKDDCFTIRCDLAIVTTVDIAIKVPPPSLQQHISDLLQSNEGTDVTFKVDNETFVAHRCVLAARSAVFKAELFGPMKEGTVSSVIDVEEMEACVFRALLFFVYTDSLPDIEIAMLEEEDEAKEALWLQHLLAAADRYDLQRLKALCEKKLCENISVSSVTNIFTLADRHNCCGLKEACLEFVKTPANLKEITEADGLDDIIRTCPSLVKELIAKFAS